ncbi:sigma-70 family RNA polymerase sigma factor [Nitriliruptoraceae bacterium ZYF776]|nr:sigma-70 family RNA polymerase sigma factor [Profundirhabdus halotolerans]
MRDAEAFTAFYEARYASVAAAVRVTLGDGQLARDAVDEAFVRAAERWPEVSRAERPAAWVYRVAVNWAHSWRRKWSRRPTRSAQALDRAHLDELPDLDLAAHLAELPLQQRQLLVLRVAFGLSVRETAALLGIAEGSVKSGVHRAKQRLRAVATTDVPTDRVEQEAHDGRP